MKDQKHNESQGNSAEPGKQGMNRRKFLKGATTAAAIAAAVPLEPLFGGEESQAKASVINGQTPSGKRAEQCFAYRTATARAEKIDLGILPDNGDNARFTDHSALWSKALLHDDIQIVNEASWESFIKALSTGLHSDFENIIVGNPGSTNFTGTLNGPQAGLALDLEGLDSHATVIPPSPSVTSAQRAAEVVEHYWGALLHDVPFSEYSNNPLVAQACADMNNLSFFQSGSAQAAPFPVTPQNLFRGQTIQNDGNVHGPFVSQFMLQPTFYGAQFLSQQLQDLRPGQHFMTDPNEYLRIQNGQVPNFSLTFADAPSFLHCGRSLSAYTHVDALHQAYFTAALVLLGIGAPLNPGNPYVHSKTEHGFGTLGGPDVLGTVSEFATRALKASWFHKWIINLRQRPEEYGALVHARLTNRKPFPQAAGALHQDVLNAAVLQKIEKQFGSFLLPQAFPEGAPSHPCYPTGHGTVGGACITALKFFFDGDQPIRPLLLAAGSDVMESSADGSTLVPYTGADRDSLTINGELSKLAWNVTTGHGIHSGIHYRSSSYFAIQLGEQVGISVLQDRAKGYNEPFTINITKFDGTGATIRNS